MNTIDRELARQDGVRITQAAKKLGRSTHGFLLGVPDDYIIYSSSGHAGIRSSYLELSDKQRMYLRMKLNTERMRDSLQAMGSIGDRVRRALDLQPRARRSGKAG